MRGVPSWLSCVIASSLLIVGGLFVALSGNVARGRPIMLDARRPLPSSTGKAQLLLPTTPRESWADQSNVFVHGHSPKPDADSIGASIGMAELYNITAVCPVDPAACYMGNVRHWMSTYGGRALPLLKDLYMPGQSKLILVDFHATTQLPQFVKATDVEVAIDNGHELDGASSVPARQLSLGFPDSASTSTAVAFHFSEQGRAPSKYAAAMLLAGVIDDTAGLNPISGTTQYDIEAAHILAKIAGVESLASFGNENFEKKSEAILTDPLEKALTMDMKVFKIWGRTLVWGTIESTLQIADRFLQREGLGRAARAVKREQGADYAIFSIVNVLAQGPGATRLLTGDRASRQIVEMAFPKASAKVANDLIRPKGKDHEVLTAACACLNRDTYIPMVRKVRAP